MSHAYVNSGCFRMKQAATLRIEEGRGTMIHVWEGQLWLTQEGDRKDHYLAAGTSFRLDRPGNAVIYATAQSVLSLSAPAARAKRSLASALRDFWAGLAYRWALRTP